MEEIKQGLHNVRNMRRRLKKEKNHISQYSNREEKK